MCGASTLLPSHQLAMISLKPVLRPLSLLVLTFFLWADFSAAPGLGVRAASAFSITEEREVGEKLLSLVRTEFKLLDDPDIAQYMDRLGREILRAAGSQYFDYNFFVISNREFNAFAAPSGLIFIHSGLLEAMENENELVSVLAHEIAHAASRHIADQIAKSSRVGIGTAALILAGIALGGGTLSQVLVTGGMAAGASMGLKFSREDEEEADRLALRYMQAMGRDPRAMVNVMRKMRNSGRYRPGVPPYLLTHPEPELRMNYVQDLLLTDKEEYSPQDQFEFARIRYRVLSQARDPMSLLPLLRREADSDKADAMTNYGLSQLYRVMADFARAEEMLRKVMAAYPDQSILTTDQGVIFFEAGRYQEALTLFNKVRATDPASAYNSYHLARTLQQLGDLGEASRIFESLLAELPHYSRLSHQLSRLRAAQGRPEEGYYYLGLYHWQEGEAESAKRYLRQALSQLPDQHQIRKEAEDLLKRIERLEKL
jgi:beta-barrel assembly-enhancing protease